MKLRQLRNDDDAVSPVIGVILMVAITVILAAVIATFVLGLGEQVSDTAPQASFDFETNGGSSASDDWGNSGAGAIVNITHAGGATLEAGNIAISGTSVSGSGGDLTSATSPSYGSSSELTAGDTITIAANDGDTLRVTWQNDAGTDSATLREYEVNT